MSLIPKKHSHKLYSCHVLSHFSHVSPDMSQGLGGGGYIPTEVTMSVQHDLSPQRSILKWSCSALPSLESNPESLIANLHL